jgi:predicted transcriptional regulator
MYIADMGEGDEMQDPKDLLSLSAKIVAAYVSANQMPAQDVPAFFKLIHSTLAQTASGEPAQTEPALEPAVAIKKSVTADFIVCLEDGKKFKSLRRHLRTRYGMSPDEYRAKWGLPHDYPMVAPNYAKERSNLAKRMGLGTSRRSG